MIKAHKLGAIALIAGLSLMPVGNRAVAGPTTAAAAAVAATDASEASAIELVQYRRGYGPPGAYGPPRGYAPRPYAYGPPRYYGGRPWGYRPWYARPYYGTIIAGVALGTIIGATAYGLAPRPPRPDLCWYWADEVQSRGYWDYLTLSGQFRSTSFGLGRDTTLG